MDPSIAKADSIKESHRPLVQVIIPAYNSATYIDACFASLINQTYQNWEALVIEDASNDGLTPQLCDSWAQKDKRIRVWHLEQNRGVAYARNRALQYATAEWIAFLDSDDLLLPNHLQSLVEAVVSSGATMAFTGYYPYQTPKGTRSANGVLAPNKLFTTREIIIRTCLEKRGMATYLWRCLFRREMFTSISFPEGRVFEDYTIFLPLISQAERIVHTGRATYNYRWTPNSIVNTNSVRNLRDYSYALLERYYQIENSLILSERDRTMLLLWPTKRFYQLVHEAEHLPLGVEREALLQELSTMMISIGLRPRTSYPYSLQMLLFSIKKRFFEWILL